MYRLDSIIAESFGRLAMISFKRGEYRDAAFYAEIAWSWAESSLV